MKELKNLIIIESKHQRIKRTNYSKKQKIKEWKSQSINDLLNLIYRIKESNKQSINEL